MKRVAIPLSFVAGLFFATGLSAQACIGLTQGSQGGLTGGMTLQNDGRYYAVNATTTTDGNLFASAHGGVTVFGGDWPNETTVGAHLAQEIEPLERTASVCPFAAVDYTFVDGFSMISVPLGVAIGRTIPLRENSGLALSPFVAPHFRWARIDIDGFDYDLSETSVGVLAGASLALGQVLVGGTLERQFDSGDVTVFGVRAGFAF